VQREAILDYLQGPFQRIGGWCSPWLWTLIGPIAARQAEMGVLNPVAEIGVYHGKFFLGLVATKGAPAQNHAIDVFDLQQFNLDGAGEGDMEQFTQNIVAAGLSPEQVTMLRTDSMALTATDIANLRAMTGGFSLFSVDGCHLVEHTLNDIRIAMELTVPAGLIFVDDYTNPDWPGVQEAVATLYLMDRPRFVPLAVLHNKLFLCHLGFHAMWLELIQAAAARLPGARSKRVTRFGYRTLNLEPRMEGHAYLGP
jgi:hypothetical protein